MPPPPGVGRATAAADRWGSGPASRPRPLRPALRLAFEGRLARLAQPALKGNDRRVAQTTTFLLSAPLEGEIDASRNAHVDDLCRLIIFLGWSGHSRPSSLSAAAGCQHTTACQQGVSRLLMTICHAS